MNDRDLILNLLKDLRPTRVLFFIGLLLYIPVTLLAIAQPLLIGYAVQQAIGSNGLLQVLSISSLFLGVVIALAAFELGQAFCLQLSGQRLVRELRQRSFAKVQRLSMGLLDRTPLGKLLTRITNDAESVAEMFSLGAIQIIADIIFLIATLVMLFFLNMRLSFYTALILPILALGIYFFRIWTKRAFVFVRAALSSLNSFLQEYLNGMPTVQMSNRLKRTQAEFDLENNHYLIANRQAVFLEAAIYSFVDSMSYVTAAIVLWGALQLKLEHALTLGVLVAFIEALSRFFQPLREISNRFAIFQSALVSLGRIYELFDYEEEDLSLSRKKIDFSDGIEFRDVSFAYAQGKEILKNINFTVKKGEHVALIGPTGAGKSSVIKLLCQFYPVTKGAIYIDQENLAHISLAQSRTLISVVPQEVFLFHGSLADNLRFGQKDASEDELWRALRLVQLEKLVIKKGGLSMMVESKGGNFSQGERQLIAFARTILTDPPIIILDEATANVDTRTESRLQQATKELLKNRTAIIIAHRLSTIIDADRILVFQEGTIVEHGTHQKLMESKGIYAGLSAIH